MNLFMSVLTLVVTVQRKYFLTAAGFTVRTKTEASLALMPSSSSASLSSSSSGSPNKGPSFVFSTYFNFQSYWVQFPLWPDHLVPGTDFHCSIAGNCDVCKWWVLWQSWQQCDLTEPVEWGTKIWVWIWSLYSFVSYKNLVLVQTCCWFSAVFL